MYGFEVGAFLVAVLGIMSGVIQCSRSEEDHIDKSALKEEIV